MQIPDTMRAMVTMGHGGPEQMVFHEDWPCPRPQSGEVLVRVGACGLNNTDVNTRSGWYSKAVTQATSADGYDEINQDDPSWGGAPVSFPRIQGADICGHIIATGDEADSHRIGERVISDNWLRDPQDPQNKNKTGYYGSECDGGFAEYAILPSGNALAINSSLSDAELATFSCSYSTAEGMLSRAGVDSADTVLVTGASGGVGGAVVQLAKLRGARVIGLAAPHKHDDVLGLGADRVLERAPAHLREVLAEPVSVIADIVGGEKWADWIDCLERGGRYTCSGAIAGPLVPLDLRTLYLRDLTFAGSTVLGPEVMRRIIGYIETGAIRPVLAATYKLEELHIAQQAFIAKQHTGNIVVCP